MDTILYSTAYLLFANLLSYVITHTATIYYSDTYYIGIACGTEDSWSSLPLRCDMDTSVPMRSVRTDHGMCEYGEYGM